MFDGLHHAAVVTRDLQKSLELYRGLGFTETLFDNTFSPEGAIGLGVPGGHAGRAVMLMKPGLETAMVELYQFLTPDFKPLPEDKLPVPPGPFVLSFESDDVHAKYEELKAAGYQCFAPPFRFHVPGFGTSDILLFLAPDGGAIELFTRVAE